MKKFIFKVVAILVFSISSLSANPTSRKDIRCLQLIPELVYPIGVDYAIPDSFVAMSPNGKLDPTEWIYWGPKEVLEKYFQNPKSLTQPLICVKVSSNVPQSKMYDEDYLKEAGDKIISSSQSQWGMYPLLAVEAKVKNQKVYSAWVGLQAECDATLLFNLVYPASKPTQQDISLWNHFLKNTTLLPEQQLYLVSGQDLQPGFTIASCNAAWDTAKIKVLAERRQRDNALRVGLFHVSDNIESECIEMSRGLKGGEWREGEPIIKLGCVVTENVSETYTNHFLQMISVFEKQVEDFSFSKEDSELACYMEFVE